MNITASDRESLIKLASSLPKGDETRKAILAGLKTASSTYEVEPAFDSTADKESFFDAAKKMGLTLKEVGGRGPLQPVIAVTGDVAKVKKFLIEEMMNGKDPHNEVDDMMAEGKTASVSKTSYRNPNKELCEAILGLLEDEKGKVRIRDLRDFLADYDREDIAEALGYLEDIGDVEEDETYIRRTASVSKTASVLSTKARAVRDSMETILDSLEGDGVFEPGDYYTMVLKWHQFLISLKNTVPDFDDSGVLKDMTNLIRLLQAQFS